MMKKIEIIMVGVLTVLIMMNAVSVTSTHWNVEDRISTKDTETIYVGGIGQGNYSSIQQAIDNASTGNTIFVYNGTYNESIVINKTISLIGKNKSSTIIDGNGARDVVYVSADWVNISGFTVKNAEESLLHFYGSNNNQVLNCNFSHSTESDKGGIFLDSSYNNIVSNCSIYNNTHGFHLLKSSRNQITDCNIYNNSQYGIYIRYVNNNTISNCNIHNNDYAINIYESSDNQITDCNIYDNFQYGIYIAFSSNNNTITYCDVNNTGHEGVHISFFYDHPSNYNLFHHNNFINNNQSVYDPHTNYWDDNIAGNYWSDYTDEDANGDGIGDTSYNISGGTNKDDYPLIEPVGTDTIKPKITVTGVENNAYYNVNVTPVITIFDINLNTNITTLNEGNFTSGTMVAEDGTYILFVQGTDKAGNSAEETITFTIDKITPTINPTSPANNSVIKPGTNLNFEITDIHLNTTTCTVNDGVAQQFSSPYNINTEDWGEGQHNITIWADDLAGNGISETFRFTIDGTFPDINIAGVTNGSYYNTNVTPLVNISDVHLNTDENNITLDNTSFISGTPVSSEGEHILYVYAVDKAGNNISQTIMFIIDKTPPTIKILEKNQTTTSSSFTIHWWPSEPIQYYEVSMDGEKWINISTNTYCTFTLSKGINTFYVKGKDLAGNTNTTTVTIERTEGKEERMPEYLIYLIPIPSVFAVALIAIIAFLKRKIRIRCPACKAVFNVKPGKRPLKTECPKCGKEGVLR